MAEYILMTALSPTMDEGTIAKWSVKEKDTISSGDVICEVETDKATMDYESSQEGTLLKILLDAGANARVGVPIGIIGDAKDDISQLITDAQQSTQNNTASNESNTEKQQSSVDNPPQKDGNNAQPASHSTQPIADNTIEGDRMPSSPLARKVAQDNGISLSSIKGSGPKGRVILKDVKQAIKAHDSSQPTQSSSHQAVSSKAMDEIVIPVSGVRKVIAKRLTDSKFSAPHFYLTISVDMQTILDARSEINLSRGKQGKPKISLNAYLMKIVAESLARNPALNATWRGDTILQFGSVDIGIAVDGKSGLITPIVKDCSRKGIMLVESELQSLIMQAREGTLQPEQYSGATFTISNLGSFGIENFTAIINPPGCAILAIGKTMPTPTVDSSGSIVVKDMMKATLTCDHRVVDGAQAARFLSTFKDISEDPIKLLY